MCIHCALTGALAGEAVTTLLGAAAKTDVDAARAILVLGAALSTLVAAVFQVVISYCISCSWVASEKGTYQLWKEF